MPSGVYIRSLEHSRKIGARLKDRPKSILHRLKIAQAHRGKKRARFSAEWRLHLREGQLRRKERDGYIHTEQGRKDISERLRGNNYGVGHSVSFEHRRKISDANSGPKHYRWKGGTTFANQKIRMSPEYRVWRKSVFERDHFTCMQCGTTKGPLNADHIKPFSTYPALRFTLSNGRTLCVPCHKKTPTYGNKSRLAYS